MMVLTLRVSLRYILGKMEVSNDYLDEILIEFIGERTSISLEELLGRFKDFVTEKPMLKTKKSLLRSSSSTAANPAVGAEEEEKSLATLQQLIFSSSARGEAVRSITIKKRQYTETLVNFLRQEAPEMIEPLISACEAKDTERKAEIEITEFVNVLRFNLPNVS